MWTWNFNVFEVEKWWWKEENWQNERNWKAKIRIQEGLTLKLRNWELNQRIDDWTWIDWEKDWREKERNLDVETTKEEHSRRKLTIRWPVS